MRGAILILIISIIPFFTFTANSSDDRGSKYESEEPSIRS